MVSLPTFSRFTRRSKGTTNKESASVSPASDGEANTGTEQRLSDAQIKQATRTRKIFALATSFFLLLTVIFLILVEIGNTHIRPVLTQTYFLKLDLSDIIPVSIPNAVLVNSIARTLGLHDFYQVGLWSFCEGYNGDGVTSCSKPKTLYWFNPIEILLNELLAGASIQLPGDINTVLHLVKTASNWMFGFFLTGTVFSTVLMFLVPLSVYSRWAALPIAILAFFNAAFITIATVVASAMFIIFRNVVSRVTELNIKASIGNQMFAFMWIATAFAIFTWLIQMGLCCCCASRRDVKLGKKKGNKKAYEKTN